MARSFFAILLFFYISIQDTSAQETEYRRFRAKISVPPYGLAKIKNFIATIKDQEGDNDTGIRPLTRAQYNSLSLRDKFTYTMIHPEAYGQNCAIFVQQPNEENKIFGYLISWMDEESWSDRQLDFLDKNKDSVIALIKESVTRSRRMGVNYKDAIIEMDAWQTIPFLIDYYKGNKKDKDVLTTLLLLMKKGKFEEFLNSPSYKVLYAADDNYEAFIYYNKANEDLILQRAEKYFSKRNADNNQ